MSVDGVNIGLLVLRLVVGLLWCGHGAQKLLGWFGARERGTLEEEFSHFGYHPALLFGRLAGTTELTGGLLLASGLLTHGRIIWIEEDGKLCFVQILRIRNRCGFFDPVGVIQ